jgi:hypothetical protein
MHAAAHIRSLPKRNRPPKHKETRRRETAGFFISEIRKKSECAAYRRDDLCHRRLGRMAFLAGANEAGLGAQDDAVIEDAQVVCPSVDPVEVISTMTSAEPEAGAPSVAPRLSTMR